MRKGLPNELGGGGREKLKEPIAGTVLTVAEEIDLVEVAIGLDFEKLLIFITLAGIKATK